MRERIVRVSSVAVAWTVCLLGAEPHARAMDVGVGVEPGAAFALDGPQKDFGVGVGLLARGFYGFSEYADVEVGGGYLGFPGASSGTPGVGLAGGGLRLHASPRTGALVPWLDGQAFYAGTSSLSRAAFEGSVGVSLAVDASKSVWVGPYARYFQVLQSEGVAGFDTTDGKFLWFGLAVEVGSSRLPPPADTDGDGTVDTEDRCPKEVGPASNQGCPIADSDGDGVKDDRDKCPRVPGPTDNDGCPYGDADSDGVLDKDDRCPAVAGPRENAGCPYGDADSDGVNDKLDHCPKEPGPAAAHGCPDPDGDGLVPPEDKCPDKAGTAENNGCPVYKAIKVTAKKIELSQKIFFAFGKAVIQDKSFGLLDEVAQALKDYPALRVRVEGHTDNVGVAAENLKLSDDRARSVRKYLVDHGVAEARVEAKGFGDTSPLDTNKTTEGREKNRRVEFVVLEAPSADGASSKPSEENKK
ncbi:MAG: OmpA family protein [Polyangiaceae bacterium]